MGQGSSQESVPRRSREELTLELAIRFKEKCFSPIEYYSMREVFKGLADSRGNIEYLKEDTLCRFLELPDILGASPIVFQMVSYLGAFPFLSEAPVIVELPQLVMVVAIMTDRYKRLLVKSSGRLKLLFKSLAVYDRKVSEVETAEKDETSGRERDGARPNGRHRGSKDPACGRAAGGHDDDDDDDDTNDNNTNHDIDNVVLAALEILDVSEPTRTSEAVGYHGAMIPTDNFRKLVMLLLLTAPLAPQQSLSQFSSRVTGDNLDTLRGIAECIVSTFVDVETSPGIDYRRFEHIIPACFPHLFAGFNGLFEHFFFSKEVDFSKHENELQGSFGMGIRGGSSSSSSSSPVPQIAQPLLLGSTEIMNEHLLAQISMFLPGSDLFHRVRLLYSGSSDGFSMGSFQSKVFNWRAPTILLVSGTRLEDNSIGGPEAVFAASLPPKRFPPGSSRCPSASDGDGQHLTFGVYVREPWKHTHKECFGDANTVLFQLEPVHDVFRASTLNTDYVTLTRPPANRSCLAFGCPHPKPTSKSGLGGRDAVFSLGSVSLLLDDTFEFGVFNHDFRSRGGAFQPSVARPFDFQERFQVEQIEVWGCGGDAEAKAQAERWAWEAREAEARRKINLGTGDREMDRALLEMAGLIGANRSGGSMG